MRNADRLLSNLQYEDARAEAESEGQVFPLSTTELLQHAIVAFSQLEREDDAEQEDEEVEEEEEDEEGMDILRNDYEEEVIQ